MFIIVCLHLFIFIYLNLQARKEGWLGKLGFFGFTRMWVVLRGGVISYSETPVSILFIAYISNNNNNNLIIINRN